MIEIPGYTLLRQLGRGGMGEVHLAVQQSLGREVALKLLTPELSQDPVACERFVREARIAANLHHPHIVPIHDVGVHQGTAYIAMEYEPGGTVAALARSPLERATALRIARDIADALDCAHAQGVVHRDVKPENVLRRPNGLCLLSDFGIARAAEAKTILTHEGASVGTPQYMSPEQLRGQNIDGRSDLYSLGVLLYQLLTGKVPYSGGDGLVLGMQHINEPIPRLPPDLAHIQPLIDSLMAKDPSARPQTGAEVMSRIDALLAGATPALTRPLDTGPLEPRRKLPWLIGASVALLALAALALWSPWRAHPQAVGSAAAVTPAVASIAVLPFADMSQAKDQEYFSDGLSEELLDLLAKIPQLHVAGRTSAFAFKGKAEDLRVIGQKLNVATVLEGSVRRSGDKVRITTQLINVADGYHLWSETYDREMTDIFAVQDEIAGAVVAALKLKLLPQQQAPSAARRSTNTDAYLQYLLGRQIALAGLDEARNAVSAYEKAIALDPKFAAAYAELAIAEISMVQFARDPGELADARRKATASADQALALDPDLAESYAARAQVRSAIVWDWSGARSDFQRALAISPRDANILRRSASLLAALGRLPEATAAARKSIELDPLAVASWNNLGFYLYATGQYPAARESLERALEINPKSALPRFNLGVAILLGGDAGAALAQFERVPEGDPLRSWGVATAEHALGHEAQSQAALDALIAMPVPRSIFIAGVYAVRGDVDKAFEWLERAYANRDYQLTYIMTQPLFAGIRSDPRYAAFLKKLGSPEKA